MCVFEWIGGAGHPQFKGVSQLIQQRMKWMGDGWRKPTDCISYQPAYAGRSPLRKTMNLPGPLNPSPRLLLGPGPSDAHPRVLRPWPRRLLGHLDPQFLEIMNETQEMLRAAVQTEQCADFPDQRHRHGRHGDVLRQSRRAGRRVGGVRQGFFGQRMIEVAGRTGRRVTVLERPWGEVFDLQQIRETLQKVRPKVLAIVQAETSTGAWQPLEGLGELCHEFDTLLIVDAVTSLGCVPLTLDAWGLDAVYSCSQKGLSCPPGLSPVSFSPRAVETIRGRKTKVQSWYLDMTLVQHYWDSDRFYHHTAPITMIYALL